MDISRHRRHGEGQLRSEETAQVKAREYGLPDGKRSS
jgi:hypothetical protein